MYISLYLFLFLYFSPLYTSDFPSVVLRPSEVYDHVAVFSFRTIQRPFVLSTSGRETSVKRYRALLSQVLKTDVRYVTYDSCGNKVIPEEFARQLRSTSCIGGAISKDIKASIVALLDEVDESARAVSSANTIVKTREGLLKGYNTDALGFLEAIRAGVKGLPISTAVCYGYGGVTNIVAACCCQLGLKVYIIGRRLEEAKRRALELTTLCGEEILVW